MKSQYFNGRNCLTTSMNPKYPHPVSYTHLDVYKRQVHTCAFVCTLGWYYNPRILEQSIRILEHKTSYVLLRVSLIILLQTILKIMKLSKSSADIVEIDICACINVDKII